MKKVLPVRIDIMKSDDCITLFSQVEQIAVTCFGTADNDVTREFVNQYKEFRQAMSGENSASFKTMYTADIATDEIWRGLNDEIRAGQRHPNPARREATNVVAEVFGRYEDPTMLPYVEEYNRIRLLIEELETLPESTLKAAVVDEWLAALRSRYDLFMDAARDHMLESSFGEMGSIKKARVSAVDAYKALVDRVSALSDLPNRSDCQQFIDMLNQYIENSPFNLSAVKRDRRSLIG